MTASLYQSGSSFESAILCSNEVVEIALRDTVSRFDAEHADRAVGRRERHEDTRPLPLVTLPRDELMSVIHGVCVERPFVERHVDEAALRMLRIQIHDDED